MKSLLLPASGRSYDSTRVQKPVTLLLLLLCIVLSHHQANAQGCLLSTEPSCEMILPLPANLSAWEVNAICADIEEHFLEYDDWADAPTEDCAVWQAVYPHSFLCPPVNDTAPPDDFCAYPRVCNLDRPLPPEHGAVNVTAGCELMNELSDAGYYPSSHEYCILAEQLNHDCPVFCLQQAADEPYLGADTDAKKWGLVWSSRVSGILSVLGALFIIIDILRDAKRRSTVLNQLLVGMALFDISSGTAWAFATAPLPTQFNDPSWADDDKYTTITWWVKGAAGNGRTCQAQSFFIQLGQTSVFYNVALATQYYLMIVRGWRDRDLKSLRFWLHVPPLIVGFALAFASIPFVDWYEYACHTDHDYRWVSIVFVVVPISVSILCITILMALIYLHVRKQGRASSKWKFGKGTASSSSSVERAVFWQCVSYVVAFLVTWPLVLAVYAADVDVGGPYAVSLLFSMLAPMQGFNNFLVYLRQKVKVHLSKNGKLAATKTVRQSTAIGTSISTAFDKQNGNNRDKEEMCDDDNAFNFESTSIDDAHQSGGSNTRTSPDADLSAQQPTDSEFGPDALANSQELSQKCA